MKKLKKIVRPIHKIYAKPGTLILTIALLLVGASIAFILLIPKGERINTNGFQVVYMSTGQAYFGKLQNTTGEYLTINTPYTASDAQAASDNKSAEPQTTLTKISQQAYGPRDTINIRTDQVLFWQNLRDDSKVAQAIKNAK